MSALKQNSSLWFLPALFSMEIIYYYIIKFANKSKKNKIFIVFILLLVAYMSDLFLKVNLPWGINSVLVLGIFFFLGNQLNTNNDFSLKSKLFQPHLLLFILLCGLLAFYFNTIVSCIDYEYGNLSLMLLSGLCLSIIIIYLAFKIKRNSILEYIGRNTMGILLFHKLTILVIQTKLGLISNLLLNSNIFIELIITLTSTFLSICFSLIATEIIRKICPLLIGENKKDII